MTARGIRENNPGNIRHSPSGKNKWQGLAKEQTDPEFVTFQSAVYGIRALARTLITYQDKHGLDTITEIISRWAPPGDNNDTGAYISSVAKSTGIGKDAHIDVHDYGNLKPLVLAIIKHENGVQPYTAAQIDKGLALAGVEPPEKPLSKSRTVNGGTVAAASTVASGAIQTIQDAQDAISPYADVLTVVKYVLIGLALVGIGLTIYARWDDFRKLAR